MKKLVRIIHNNLLEMFSTNNVIAILLIFIFINYITNNLYNIDSINSLIMFSFWGPKNLTDNTIELFKWTFCQMLIIYIVMNFVSNQHKKRNCMLILRIGSKLTWINGIILSALIGCFLYFTIGFFILITFNFHLLFNTINFVQLIKLLCLFSLCAFISCLVGIVLNIIIKNEPIIFGILLFSYYFSISIGDKVALLDKLFLFNQGILVKHYLGNFISFQWSYLYTIFFSLIIYLVVRVLYIKRDL